MTERTGPFWAGVRGEVPMPKAAATLGLGFVDVDPDAGTIELTFDAPEDWTNPFGNVLGAFVAAMLYDTVGPVLIATLAPEEFQATTQFNMNFLRPVRPGRLRATGRIEYREGDHAVLSATLYDPRREPGADVVATATALARVIPAAQAPDAV